MRSVVVVLPASMWAMMPILRIWRRSVGSGSLAMFVCSSSRQYRSIQRGLAAEIQHLPDLPVWGLLSSLWPVSTFSTAYRLGSPEAARVNLTLTEELLSSP